MSRPARAPGTKRHRRLCSMMDVGKDRRECSGGGSRVLVLEGAYGRGNNPEAGSDELTAHCYP